MAPCKLNDPLAICSRQLCPVEPSLHFHDRHILLAGQMSQPPACPFAPPPASQVLPGRRAAAVTPVTRSWAHSRGGFCHPG